MKLKLQHNNEWITLATTSFAGGGEGNLYRIVAPRHWTNYVAKVYHTHKLSEKKELKIKYLATYPPRLATEAGGTEHPSVIWVKDALYDTSSQFVGFIMPFTEGEKLEILSTPKIPRKLRQQWKRFSFKSSTQALEMRMKLSFNICAAIHQIHATNRYILVDMKPDNIVIKPNGLVAIVDTDSVEVIENGKSIFDAPVATPEYSPPEHYQELDYDPTQRQEWDLFGLGVILYKLLFGIHPFAASAKAPYENLTTLQDKIKAGLFVHNPALENTFSVVPPLHRAFFSIDPSLQELFMRCFVGGHHDPALRPTAEEWCATLLYGLDDKTALARFGHILGIGNVTLQRKPHFPLPSNQVTLPSYQLPNQKMLTLLDNEIGKLLQPQWRAVAPNDELHFQKQAKLEKKGCWVMLVAIGVPIGILSKSFVVPLIGVAILLYSMYNSSLLVKEKTRTKKEYQRRKTNYKRLKDKAKDKHKNYRKILGNVAVAVNRLTDTLQTQTEQLRQYMATQDAKVKKIQQQALEHYEAVQRKYVRLALDNRAVARTGQNLGKPVAYDSITKLRIDINKTYQKTIGEMTDKIKIDFDDPAYRQQKLAIDDLVRTEKRAIETAARQELEKVSSFLTSDVQLAKQELDKRADIEASAHRLWERKWFLSESRKKRLLQELEAANLISILQIKRIDIEDKYIRTHDGRTVRINDKDALVSLFKWQNEIKHEVQQLQKLEQQQEQEKKLQIESIQQEKRIALSQLQHTQKKELQAIKVIANTAILGEPYRQVQQEYQTVTAYMEELETEQVTEQKNLQKEWEQKYQQILNRTQQEIAEAQANMKQLEKEMQRYDNLLSQSKVQHRYKQLDRELTKAKTAVAQLERSYYEKERFKNINFLKYIATLVKRR